MELMIGLGILGIALLLAAPLLARAVIGREGDPTGLTRIIQGLAVVLLIIALVFRPHRSETAAFPPPPDAPASSN
ncbi:MAG TPA: hypothetical protein VFZ18_04780 [Longimicrobiaceae bacterium]